MQFRTKIIGFAIVLALGAAICATLTIVLARGIERGMASVTLAEDQLTLYLALETDISDMLMLQIATATVPTAEKIERLSLTKAAVRRDLQAIRGIVEQELILNGEQDQSKLAQVDLIGLTLDDIEAALEQISTAGVDADSVGGYAAPIEAVIDALDNRLAPAVDLAVAQEAAKVIIARKTIADLSMRSAQLGTVAGLLTLLAAVVGTLWLLMSFMRPFGALLEGASRLAKGDLTFRILHSGSDEMGRLSQDFNDMAEQLERSDQALRAEEQNLQRRVASRTAELEQANAWLAQQDATRRRFLADVSHELRTPLTVMRGEAEVALRERDNVLNDSAREALAAVVEQSEHMSRLVDDLLFVARGEEGQVPLRLAQIRLGDQLERTVADARQLAPDTAIELYADTAALSSVVKADPGRLHQMLMVLLDNASRYSPSDCPITVNVERTGTQATVSVRDGGIGIPENDLPHIFDRFVRGSNALPGGTGLGLPVAKAIAEAHGGSLSIESTEGEGTCVALTLPVCAKGQSK